MIDAFNGNYIDLSTDAAGTGISVGTNGVSVYEHAAGYMPCLLSWEGAVNGWTHIAVVYNDKTPYLYVNGVLVKTGLTSWKTDVYASNMVGSGIYGVMNGQFDEVRVWGRVRTQAEIMANMNSTVSAPQTDLAAYWPINDGESIGLTDMSGNGYDVVLNTAYSGSNFTPSTAMPLVNEGRYRYGFNGKENDNEVKGEGNQQDYGFRIYDPRLGRFLSVDPLTDEYPWYTPYQFAGNDVIRHIDLDGLEPSHPLRVAKEKHPIIYGGVAVADKAWRFVKGLGKAVVSSFGALTQVAAAAHYGDKVPKDKFAEAFPLLANDNMIKDIVIPMFTSPVDLANRLKKSPGDAELWGEAAGLFLLIKGGKYTGKFKSSEFGLKVDLMGGEASRYGSKYLNYDLRAKVGIADGVENFKNHFLDNTVKEIVVNNPQAPFLEHVSSALQADGTITVRGQFSNSHFADIWDGKAKGLAGYEVLPGSKKTGLSTEGFTKTDGTPLRGANNSLNELILKKKK